MSWVCFSKSEKNHKKSLSHDVKNTELCRGNNYTADGADSMICSFEVWKLNCSPVLFLSWMSPRLLFSRVQKLTIYCGFQFFWMTCFHFINLPPLWTPCDSLRFIWKSHVGQRQTKAYQRTLSHAISLNDCVCNFPEPTPDRVIWFLSNKKIKNNTRGMFPLWFNLR